MGLNLLHSALKMYEGNDQSPSRPINFTHIWVLKNGPRPLLFFNSLFLLHNLQKNTSEKMLHELFLQIESRF